MRVSCYSLMNNSQTSPTRNLIHLHIGHHFWGAGNIGDDWMLAGFLEAIKSRGYQFRITCCIPQNHDAMRLRFPQIEWFEMEIGVRETLISSADVWIGLGDTPFQSHAGTWLLDHIEEDLMICHHFRTPVYFLGVGAEGPEACHLPQTGRVLEQARHIWTRDELSAELLCEVTENRARITPAADLAHIYFDSLPVSKTNHLADHVGLVINVERAEQLNVKELLKFISLDSRSQIRWIAQEVRNMPVSEVHLWEQFMPSVKEKLACAMPNYQDGTIESFLTHYTGLSVLLSTRYHSALVAAWKGIAVSVYARSQKLNGLVSQFGYATCESLATVEKMVEGLANAKPITPSTLRKAARAAQAACDEFFQEITAIQPAYGATSAKSKNKSFTVEISAKLRRDLDTAWVAKHMGFGKGVHPQEGASRWLADRAEIHLPSQHLSRAADFTFALSAGDLWCYGKQLFQTVINLDGKLLRRLFFNRDGQKFEVTIRLEPKPTAQLLIIESTASFVPAQVDSSSGDQRRLAVKFSDLSVVEISDSPKVQSDLQMPAFASSCLDARNQPMLPRKSKNPFLLDFSRVEKQASNGKAPHGSSLQSVPDVERPIESRKSIEVATKTNGHSAGFVAANISNWPDGFYGCHPQRYEHNYPKYIEQGGLVRPGLDVSSFVTANGVVDPARCADTARYYFFCLAFDHIVKEGLRGHFAELGVDKGHTAALLAAFARRIGVTLYALDTFEGFSEQDLKNIDAGRKIEFTDTSLERVRATVGEDHVRFIKGHFPGSTSQMPDDLTFSFVHIDCDLYAPTRSALEYFYPRMTPGGFIVIHDYHSLFWDGLEKAVDEFFHDKPETVLPVPDACGTVAVRKVKTQTFPRV